MKLLFWRKPPAVEPPPCDHEWILGVRYRGFTDGFIPVQDWHRATPAICRWCKKRTELTKQEENAVREWQRLEREHLAWPSGAPLPESHVQAQGS